MQTRVTTKVRYTVTYNHVPLLDLYANEIPPEELGLWQALGRYDVFSLVYTLNLGELRSAPEGTLLHTLDAIFPNTIMTTSRDILNVVKGWWAWREAQQVQQQVQLIKQRLAYLLESTETPLDCPRIDSDT